MTSPFLKYIEIGWKLVPLSIGDKATTQTGWNKEELALSTPEDVEGVEAAGLAHAYSGTCAIDIDDIKASYKFMLNHDVDLKELYYAANAVRITSGRKNRAKLIYKVDQPLRSVKIIDEIDGKKKNIIDFRCATSTGATVQDALPPSIHPKTKKPYRWEFGDELVGDIDNLPQIPEALLKFWESQIQEREQVEPTDPVDIDSRELAELVQAIDPDEDYNEWLHVGMAIHHATSGSQEGLDIWDTWSSNGDKYKGRRDLVPHWRSMKGSGITIDYLLMHQVAEPEVFENVTTKKDEQKAARFTPVRVTDWVQRPPPTWLIHGVLPQSDLAMIFGEPGSGKSFFAMDIAMAIANGMSWNERNTGSGTVLWIAAEAAGSVRNRSIAYGQHHQFDLEESDFWIIGDHTPNLSNVDDAVAIAREAAKKKPRVVVVDTMVAAAGGANENSGEDMGKILDHCRGIHRASGALVLLIHHSGKDKAKGSRGWSGIKGAMQTEIEITVDEMGQREAKVIKQRDGEQDLAFDFKLVPVNLAPHDGIPQTSCAVEMVEGVTLQETFHGSEWVEVTYLRVLGLGEDDANKQRILNDVSKAGVSLNAAPEDIDECGDKIQEMVSEMGAMLITANEISLMGDPIEDEEF